MTVQKTIAAFSVVGSAASIVGLVAIFYGAESDTTITTLKTAFVATLFLCYYVLFVPGNRFLANVSSKIVEYDLDASQPNPSKLIIQQDIWETCDGSQVAIEFDAPFVEPPEIELVAIRHSAAFFFPTVDKVTCFQFIISRKTYHMGVGRLQTPDRYRWIAKGTLLKPAR